MKLSDIRIGGYYAGPSGQIRRVLKMANGRVTFEVVARGILTANHTCTLDLGTIKSVKTATLASWAHREAEAAS